MRDVEKASKSVEGGLDDDKSRYRTSLDDKKWGKRSLFIKIEVQEGFIRKESPRTLREHLERRGKSKIVAKSKICYRNS